ncbi:isochorismatase family protein [Micromonospora sp. NPDC023814]|uniref:isochorismatase family protein n=1 Tax=Micromonospora sp. NPDC023814 TaxID=3154596 RepID=UPI00340AF15A
MAAPPAGGTREAGTAGGGSDRSWDDDEGRNSRTSIRRYGPVTSCRAVRTNRQFARRADRAPRTAATRPPGSDFAEGLVEPGDVVVVKRTVGAFHGTDLHEQLRRRGVDTVVLAGLVTTMGVESTARAASDHSYELEFVADAMSGFAADEHEFTVERIFPRFGAVRRADNYR